MLPLLKEELQVQSTGASFCIFSWSNTQVLSKSYCLLIISPCYSCIDEIDEMVDI